MAFVTRDILISRLHHVPGQKVAYLNNAKVACSTIKSSLWQAFDEQAGTKTYAGYPHQRSNSPFLKGIDDFFRAGFDSVLAAEWFSVVRNPFVRVLSAYLDKMPLEHRDPNVWRPLKKRFRMSNEYNPTFREFLDVLLTETVPDFLDWHFCPQTANLLYGFAPLSYVGQLECMGETEAWLADRGILIKPHRPHARHAEALIPRFYGSAEVDAVIKLYGADFDAFGYARDPGRLAPIHPVTPPERDTEPLRLFLLCYKPGSPAARRSAFDALAKLFNGAEFVPHLLLDADLAQANEIMAVFKALKSGEIVNWRTALKAGQVLAHREMVLESAKALEIACSIMYPTRNPLRRMQRETAL